MTPAQYLAPLLPPVLDPAPHGQAYAPSNIALIKYWGKRDPVLNLPHNGSLSISLAEHGTHTAIRAAASDSLTLNGEPVAADSAFYRRTFAFVNLIRRATPHPLAIDSRNTTPPLPDSPPAPPATPRSPWRSTNTSASTSPTTRYPPSPASAAAAPPAPCGTASSNGNAAAVQTARTASPPPSAPTGKTCASPCSPSTPARKKPPRATA